MFYGIVLRLKDEFMVTFTDTDANLSLIMQEAKLFNLVTKFKYHCYGLRLRRNYPISIDYNGTKTYDATFIQRLNGIVTFFKNNGIEMEICNQASKNGVNIGLRLDVRQVLNSNKKPIFAASVLSTIVYCLEDRLDIEQMKKFVLPSIPKFKVTA